MPNRLAELVGPSTKNTTIRGLGHPRLSLQEPGYRNLIHLMRPPRSGMRDVDVTRVALIINTSGTTDPTLDHAIRGDRTGTRAADMDIGTILDLQVPGLYPSRTAYIAFQLPGLPL